MKITIPVEVELEDWSRQGYMVLREHVGHGSIGDDKFTVSQSGATFFVERDGGEHSTQWAVVKLQPALEASMKALLDHAEAVAKEPKRADTAT